MTYDTTGKRIRTENLAGQATTTAWDCCHKVSETRPDGSVTTWDYDDEDRLVVSSRLIPLDLTNVTWVATCYAYDDLGRQTATWTTNCTAQVGTPATTTAYDRLGRVASRTAPGRGTSLFGYSADGLVVTNTAPNGATTVARRSADGDTLSVTGTGVTPEFHSYGILPDGTRWTKTVEGETADSPRFTKRYENLLGQIVREERSGFCGALLATVHAYDSYGRLVSTVSDGEPVVEYSYNVCGERIGATRTVGSRVPRDRPGEWRKSESQSNYALVDSDVWSVQTNITSCSDAAIAPLVQSRATQLTGLTAAAPDRMRTTDIRGNVTEDWSEFVSGVTTSKRRVPEATNVASTIARYGVQLATVSHSFVTNSVCYDGLGRSVVSIDGRGNATRTEYDACGRRAATIDPLGARTSYAYNDVGELVAVTNALGHATVYEYDLRGQKAYEGGATYPVRYAYDVFGNKIAMTTYRDESQGADSGDTTRWLYDIASNCMTNKVYADGNGPAYDYDANGRLTKRTWARGIDTFYTYDGWGNLTNTTYSDTTATGTWQITYNGENRPILWTCLESHNHTISNQTIVTMSYDRMGRRVAKNDQRFVYNGYLQIAVNGGNAYVWDVMEPVATRPLAWRHDGATLFYTHDGNKNVSEVVSIDVFLADHYEYAPFGAVILRRGGFAAAAPWRFSSECFDDETEAIYYNFRHYVPWCGRWSRRDSAGEDFGPNLFGYIDNGGTGKTDVLGLFDDGGGQKVCVEHKLEIEVAYGGLSFQWVCVYWKRIKGHRDFENNGTVCPFDYTKEDYDWKSSPFAPWGIDRHFKERKDIVGGKGTSVSGHHSQDAKKSGVKPGENLLLAVIGKCDPNAFQSLMHQLQDTRVHNGNGFKAHNWSWKFPFYEPGHAWHGSGPDHNDESQKWRWNLAEEDTHYYVNLWKTKCQLKDACKCTWRKVGE